jgi:hypothetical protein
MLIWAIRAETVDRLDCAEFDSYLVPNYNNAYNIYKMNVFRRVKIDTKHHGAELLWRIL